MRIEEEDKTRYPIDQEVYDLYFKALAREDLDAHQKEFLKAFKSNIDDIETDDLSHKQLTALRKIAEGEAKNENQS
jgi:hypothetical protein